MVVITGANGFIGSAIVWRLNQRGRTDLVCVDTAPPTDRPELLRKRSFSRFVHSDHLWDFLNSAQDREKIEWVIHMGACSSTTETNAEFLWQNNTFYSIRLFQWCAENNVNLIYASSAATYGDGRLGFSDETDSEQLQALNLYGSSKLNFDRWVVRQPTQPEHWYGLKFFNVYGPNEYHKGEQASVVHKAYHQILNTGRLKLFKSYRQDYADGEQIRDFVYIKDIVEWVEELMQRTPKSGIYNNGSGQGRTWKALAHACFRAMNREVNIDWIEMPENIREHYQYYTEANMTKWLNAGLSKPEWSIERGVEDYIRNYMATYDPYL